jgi:hypothetical protein
LSGIRTLLKKQIDNVIHLRDVVHRNLTYGSDFAFGKEVKDIGTSEMRN